jgi:hypothetical protein
MNENFAAKAKQTLGISATLVRRTAGNAYIKTKAQLADQLAARSALLSIL